MNQALSSLRQIALRLLIVAGFPLLTAAGPEPAEPRGKAKSEAPAAVLPQRIPLKTPGCSFNSRFDYCLRQGRIWYRPHWPDRHPGEPPVWELMPCEGLPCNPDAKAFEPPRPIAEISADGDELTALDVEGRFYFRTMAGPGWFSRSEWTQLSGFPRGVLRLPPELGRPRAWSMGRRHFDVLWHEDADGNPHHVGTTGTSTLYALHPEGYEIWYSDNGLPADFSHRICGPERGGLQLENLQASAGTLFAIDAAGQTYTVMSDFDLNGGTAMFIPYSYVPQARSAQPPGSDFGSHLTPWRLPPPLWRRQPAIPLTGRARLSRSITILQTGQGNAARELRVAGLDAAGRSGYYFKPIDGPGWEFAAAETGRLDWLPGTAVRRLAQDRAYTGVLQFGAEVYQAELADFNLDCSPARLSLKRQATTYELKLHAVDAWTHASCENPGRDGAVALKLGTLEAEVPDSLPPGLRRLHLATFALPLAATLDQLYVFDRQGSPIGELLRPGAAKTLPPVGPLARARLRGLGRSEAWQSLLARPELAADPAGLSRDQVQELLAANQELLADFEQDYALIEAAQDQAWLEALGTALLHSVYLGSGMCWWMPYGPAFCRSAPELMSLTYAIEDELAERRQLRYRQWMYQLRFRLQRCRERLAAP